MKSKITYEDAVTYLVSQMDIDGELVSIDELEDDTILSSCGCNSYITIRDLFEVTDEKLILDIKQNYLEG